MTPERWEQIKSSLYRAMQVGPEQRSAFLESACSDVSLHSEVENLLAADDQARSSFLQRGHNGGHSGVKQQWNEER